MPPADLPGDLESLRLHTGGVALHAMAAGPADGPLVVLLHGFPEFWYGWRHQLGPLARAGFRVLAPGGRICVLEITRPDGRVRTTLLRAYMRGLVPLVARVFGRHAESAKLMRYYWDTIDQCVSPATILDVLRRHGFVQVKRRVYCGFLSEYVAVKAARSAESAA